ncbi:EMYY motif lipoprotein [Staphylococcus lutrae]|uniref:EMYY motif lipoprotein n=1 Tax=Staphylococcus lutrae TaxID=155085 RepID=A0AAC9RRY0_9STAP|nr:EMYY motif lipoprotein [Staphylococcus lutrae]ARJ51268.1 hypothetical protein B5P37_08070 [Staphylococcus lutrae]PNZ39514.1 EMYY motif lipoprotein [Staphylococcus lutrae]
MKKWTIMLILSLVALGGLTACFPSSRQQQHAFDQQMQTVMKQELKIKQTMDQMDLNQLYHLSQTDTTDANKRAFSQMKHQIDEKLKPQMKHYHQAAEKLPAENKDLKLLKATYLKGVEGKEKEIEKLEQFVVLCQNSIQTNENILDDTQQFEKYRSRVENQLNRAKQSAQGIEDSMKLEAQLDKNNSRIKNIAETSIREKDEDVQIKTIKTEIIPLIQDQIKALNETQLKDEMTSQVRQDAVQMYYSLERYYQARIKTITYNQKLSQVDVHTLITKGEDLEKYNQDYENQRDQMGL